MNRLCFVLLFIFSVPIYSQEERITIEGIIKSDSLVVENVHIINSSSRKGTISNSLGKFQLSVKTNDTLHFSDIQFKNKVIIILKKHVTNKKILVNLIPRTNELREVTIKQSRNMAKTLRLPNADKKPLNKLERNLNYYSQKSTPIVILQALLMKGGGIDDIYNIISGKRKKDRKLKKLVDEDKKVEINQEYIQTIRNHFTDDFFLNTLKIPKEKIDNFIAYCLPQGIMFLYRRDRFVEIIDIFIKNKDGFLSSEF